MGAMTFVTRLNTVTMASFDLIVQAKPQSHTTVLDISKGLSEIWYENKYSDLKWQLNGRVDISVFMFGCFFFFEA